MKLNPLHDQVVVKRLTPETQTASGIFIPEVAAEKPDQGIVLAVGPGRRTESGSIVPMTVTTDDKILFPKFAGQPVKIDGEELLILREMDIFAVLEA